MPARRSARLTSIFYMLVNVITWGAFLPIVKLGFEGSTITPFRYLFYRFTLASILSLPIVVYYWSKVPNIWRTIGTIIGIEIIGTSIALSFLYTGLHHTTSLEANLIATTLPIFVTLGGMYFLKEREEKSEWMGLFLSFGGTLLLIIGPLCTGASLFRGSLLGNLLIVGHNIAAVAYALLVKKWYGKLPKLFVSSISFFVGVVTFAIASFWESGAALPSLAQAELASSLILSVVFYAAVFGSLIGLTAYIKGQEGMEASEASLFSYLQPLIFIPLGILLLHERITALQIIALCCILIGVYIAERPHQKVKKLKRKKKD